jgi:hypothetical protein
LSLKSWPGPGAGVGLGQQALDGLGLLAGAWQWDGGPGSVRLALAQRGEESLGGGALYQS